MSVRFSILDRALLSLDSDEFDHRYRNGREVDCAGRQVVCDVWVSQAFLKCSFHLILESRVLGSLGDRSINDRTEYGQVVSILAKFRCPSGITEESYHGILEYDRDSHEMISYCILEPGS